MPIDDKKPVISYFVRNNTTFNIPFKFIEESDIAVRVQLDEKASNIRILQQGHDFSIEGGQINLITPVPYDAKLEIQRKTDIDQNTEFFDNAKIPAATLNAALDKLTMILQEHEELFKKTIRIDSIGTPGSADYDTLDLQKMLSELIELQSILESTSEFDKIIQRAAISAAQALESAVAAKQARDEAEEIKNGTIEASDIAAHNTSPAAHQDIRRLINNANDSLTNLDEKIELHLTDYDAHIADNQKQHDNFSAQISNINAELENVTGGNVANKSSFYAFGDNTSRQLSGRDSKEIATAIFHPGMQYVSQVAISGNNGIAINKGRIWVSGIGTNGVCGPAKTDFAGFQIFAPLSEIGGFTDVACAGTSVMALKDGKLYSWGNGGVNCLGDGTTVNRTIPEEISIESEDVTVGKITKIVGGQNMFLALDENNNLFTCGESNSNGLGTVGVTSRNYFEVIENNEAIINISDITVGGSPSSSKDLNFAAVIAADKLWVWGKNANGQLGNKTFTDISVPTLLTLEITPVKVRCGNNQTILLDTDGKAYIAGTTQKISSFTQVILSTESGIALDEKIIDIAAGMDVSYFLTENGKLYALGTASNGSMLASSTSEDVPVLIYNKPGIDAIFAHPNNAGLTFTVQEA